MLQRAASNAYSWWCASHIRTNQSKWLDGNLQEMEERVQAMLKIIEEDADSFAKRAEMYYKRRPELINFVEETYRAYRALAERFDHVSGELHKANHTLATAFPDVQFPMQDEDDDNYPEALPSTNSTTQKPPPDAPQLRIPKPKQDIPQKSSTNKSSENKPAPKKSQPRSGTCQISEDRAKDAVDKLQKAILVLQTEKEFIKSSYETGIAKYWEIEKTITEMQEEVCYLQDEFSASAVIEDDEARALMAVTALKSCKDSLDNLQEQQKKSIEETTIESERIKIAKEKLKSLRGECGQPEEMSVENTGTSAPSTTTDEETSDMQQESIDFQFRDHFEINSHTSVMELAEKIDEVVNKLFSLELTVSSQTAQIQSLRSETDDLQKHLQSLEQQKSQSPKHQDQVKTAEKMQSLQHQEQVKTAEKMQSPQLQDQVNTAENLQSPKHQVQVKTAENLQSPKHQGQVKTAEKLQSPKYSDQVEIPVDISLVNLEPQEETEVKSTSKIQDAEDKVDVDDIIRPKNPRNHIKTEPVSQLESEIREKDSPSQADNINHLNADPEIQHDDGEEDSPILQELLSNGEENKEKILLAKYTSILRSYTETKRKLLEVEKKNQENFRETMSQVSELKSANAVKDGEIQSLRQALRSLPTSSDSKLKTSETSEDLNSEGAAKQNGSSGVQDRGRHNAEEEVKLYHLNEQPHTPSAVEEKFRKDIDTLLDENLEFWLRFSTSFHQIQRFRDEFQHLQSDVAKMKDSKLNEGSQSGTEKAGKSESTPVDKQLRELKTELQVWVEQNALLRGELQSRFSSLCNIQEEISGALKESSSEAAGVKFSPYQAAKFQGEVLNMQQENNKVADELQAGLDHVKGLQAEVEEALSTFSKLQEKIELSSSKRSHHTRNLAQFSGKNKGVPLRSFLYGGGKPKKSSIFSCMSPAHQKKLSDLKSGMPL